MTHILLSIHSACQTDFHPISRTKPNYHSAGLTYALPQYLLASLNHSLLFPDNGLGWFLGLEDSSGHSVIFDIVPHIFGLVHLQFPQTPKLAFSCIGFLHSGLVSGKPVIVGQEQSVSLLGHHWPVQYVAEIPEKSRP
jgi:hypothetical protein